MKYKLNLRIICGGKLEFTIVEVDVEALIPTVTGVLNVDVGISKCKIFVIYGSISKITYKI